jgi:DHA1 family bicyclomycin/chloramphenicol resistance-like MFS transporter
MLIMGLAPILAPLGGGALLAFGGWRLIFGFITISALIIGVCAFFRLQESRSEETAAHARSENPLKAYMALLRQRRLIGYGLAGTLNGATLFTYVASSPDLLIGIYKIPAADFGWVFSLNAIAIIGANQLNRLLLRRWTTDEILAKSSLAAVIAAAALSVAAVSGIGGAFTVLPLLFVLLGSYGFMGGNTMAGALSVDPIRAGSISALLGGASFGAGAVASWAAGVLHDGTPRPMALVMLVCLIGSAVTLRALALRRRP